MSGTLNKPTIFEQTNSYVRKNVIQFSRIPYTPIPYPHLREKPAIFNSSLAELANYLRSLNPHYKLQTQVKAITPQFIQETFIRAKELNDLGILTPQNLKKIKTLLNHTAREEQERLKSLAAGERNQTARKALRDRIDALQCRIYRERRINENYDEQQNSKYQFRVAYLNGLNENRQIDDTYYQYEQEKLKNQATKKGLKRKALAMAAVVGINSGLVSSIFAVGKTIFGMTMTLAKAMPFIFIPATLINFALFYGSGYRTQKRMKLGQMYRTEDGGQMSPAAKKATYATNLLASASAFCSFVLYFTSAATAFGAMFLGTGTSILPFAAMIAAGPVGWGLLGAALLLGGLTGLCMRNAYSDTATSLIAKLTSSKAFKKAYEYNPATDDPKGLGRSWEALTGFQRFTFCFKRTFQALGRGFIGIPGKIKNSFRSLYNFDPMEDGGEHWKQWKQMTPSERSHFYIKKTLNLVFGVVSVGLAAVVSGLFYLFSPNIFQGDTFKLINYGQKISAALSNKIAWAFTGVGSVLNFVFKTRGIRTLTDIVTGATSRLITGIGTFVRHPIASTKKAGGLIAKGFRAFRENPRGYFAKAILGVSAFINGVANALALGSHIVDEAPLFSASTGPNLRESNNLTSQPSTGMQPPETLEATGSENQSEVVSREQNIRFYRNIYQYRTIDEIERQLGNEAADHGDKTPEEVKQEIIGKRFYDLLAKNANKETNALSEEQAKLYTTANVFQQNIDAPQPAQRCDSPAPSVASASSQSAGM